MMSHFDVTREERNTPPKQLTDVVDHLRTPLSLTYFYNAGDPNALAVRDLVAIAARNHPLLAFRAIDLDKEPGLARDIGVHSYNTAVLAGGRPQGRGRKRHRCRSAGLRGLARRFANARDDLLCHRTWRDVSPDPGPFSLQPRRNAKGHDTPGAGDVLVAEPEQLDRLQLALNEIGFDHTRDRHGGRERNSVRLRRGCRDRSTDGVRRRAKRSCWPTIWRLAGGS